MQLRGMLGGLAALDKEGLIVDDRKLDAAINQVMEQLRTAKQIPLKTAPPMPTQLGR